MKKQITLKRLLLLGALALVVFLIGSCKKDLLMSETPNSFEPIPSIKLTEVKQWYSRNEGLITSEFNWLNSLSPKWDSVRVQNNEKGSIYEAVLNNPDKIFATDGAVNLKDSRKKYAPKSSIRLLIFRDELGQSYRSCFMEVIATGESELPQELSYKNYGNLNGLVSFYELDGKLANSWVYSNGKAVMSTSSNGALKVGSSARSKSGVNGRIMFDDGPPEGYIDCGNRLVAHTREVCGEVGGLEGPGYDGGEGSGKICREEMYFVSERIYCPIPPGGSGNGEYNPPNPTTPGAGGTGSDPVPLDTLDSVKNTCLKAAIKMALANGVKNDFKKIMDSTILGNHELILILKEENLGDTSIMGKFTPWYDNRIGNKMYLVGTINFNTQTIPGASQEMMVWTLYHEMLHAYLTRLGGGLLFPTYNHQYMATTYVNRMSAALQRLFPGMPNEDSIAFGWAGLEGTPMYALKPQLVAERMALILDKYKRGTLGHTCP